MIGHRQAILDVAEIDNPWFSRAHDESASNPRIVKAVINAGIDELTFLARRNSITAAQKRAGDRFSDEWQAMYCIGGSAFAEFVNTGHKPRQFGHRQAEAWSELERCKLLLGPRSYRLVRRICGEGYRMRDLCPVPPNPPRLRTFWVEHLKLDLDTLATMWGYG